MYKKLALLGRAKKGGLVPMYDLDDAQLVVTGLKDGEVKLFVDSAAEPHASFNANGQYPLPNAKFICLHAEGEDSLICFVIGKKRRH